MTDFSINTHHAYLNTSIIICNKTKEPIVVQNVTTSEKWTISDRKVVRLSAGKHRLVSKNTELEITVEDAIKLGGSRIKKTFVFDDSPWIFITTQDRLYAANIETGEETVEYAITPDSIASLQHYYGKTCEYFLFNTKNVYSIYNVETGKVVKTFSNHIYSNGHLVIYHSEENKDSTIVYDYRLDKIIAEFDGQYSIGRKFYFVKEGKLYGLNLTSSYIKLIDEVGNITEDYILYDNYLLKLKSNTLNSKTYHFFALGNGEKNINSTSFTVPYYIESWVGHSLCRWSIMKDEYDKYKKDCANQNRDFSNVKHHIFSIAISRIDHKRQNKKHIIQLTGEMVSYPSIGFSVPFTLSGIYGSDILFKDAVIEHTASEIVDSKQSEPTDNMFQLPKEEKSLGQSLSGNRIVSISNDKIIYRDVKNGMPKFILTELFDTSHYIDAYFTSDGKNAIFVSCNKEFNIMGFEDLSLDKYDVEGMTVARGINGYQPEYVITDSKEKECVSHESDEGLQDSDFREIEVRQPVWRDPISLTKVKQDELSNHLFMSADGTYSAENNYKVIIRDRIKNKDITNEEYNGLCRTYNFQYNDTEADKEKKIFQRKFLLEKVGKEILFSHVIDQWNRLLSNSSLSEREKKKHIEEGVNSEIDEYINKKECFTPLFLDRLGYVIYKDNRTSEEKRILIGRSVFFLNYVSFSYDSRYLAFGAKMKGDDFRRSESGVFVLYDLQEEKEILRQDDRLSAVWMTMFSKDGNVAYYDSTANAYMRTKESEYKDVQKIAGKSLLCFSPSGKYIAFSDQKYISLIYHPNADWGHQPSGNIFIHAVKDIQECIEQYNDFGNRIAGVASRAGSVASAAFSCDEKRLMAVGDDGVVVVRNLHLPDESEKHDNHYNETANDMYRYNTHYGEYAGSYAQEVMGYSDDFINDAFDGDPDAYWNID